MRVVVKAARSLTLLIFLYKHQKHSLKKMPPLVLVCSSGVEQLSPPQSPLPPFNPLALPAAPTPGPGLVTRPRVSPMFSLLMVCCVFYLSCCRCCAFSYSLFFTLFRNSSVSSLLPDFLAHLFLPVFLFIIIFYAYFGLPLSA